MNTNFSRAGVLRNVTLPRIWLGLLLCSVGTGCHQTYHHGMYGQPYAPAGAYGAPYGQPMAPMQMQQMPMSPTQMQMAPGISSIPQENFYAPSPLGGGSAPAFGNPAPAVTPNPPANNGNNTVPKYNDPTSSNSPYFQQSSLRQDLQAPQMSQIPAAAVPAVSAQNQTFAEAGGESVRAESAQFARMEPQEANTIDQVSDEQFQAFEPPITTSPAPPANRAVADKPAANAQFMTDVPAPPVQEPLPMNTPFALSPPPGQSAAPVQGQPEAVPADPFGVPAPAGEEFQQAGLQGPVRFLPATQQWVLIFESNGTAQAPYGGQLPLTGSPELLNSLKSGQSYNLMGELELHEGSSPGQTFRVKAAEPIGSPF